MSYTDIADGKWHQMKGRIKEEWSDLTDDELGQIEGRIDRLVGLLEDKFGVAKNEARKKLLEFEAELESRKDSGHASQSR